MTAQQPPSSESWDIYDQFMMDILSEHVNESEYWGRVDCHCGFGPVTRTEWAEHVCREIKRKLQE